MVWFRGLGALYNLGFHGRIISGNVVIIVILLQASCEMVAVYRHNLRYIMSPPLEYFSEHLTSGAIGNARNLYFLLYI